MLCALPLPSAHPHASLLKLVGLGGGAAPLKIKTSNPGWELKALDGRKIFIDHVTKPAHYDPPGIEPGPPGPVGDAHSRYAIVSLRSGYPLHKQIRG